MNWTTLHRIPQPEDFEPGARPVPTLTHVCVQGDTLSLCSGAGFGPVWADGGDEHPEDVDSLDRCTVCYSVYERRNREDRGRDPLPSNRLGVHVRRRDDRLVAA